MRERLDGLSGRIDIKDRVRSLHDKTRERLGRGRERLRVLYRQVRGSASRSHARLRALRRSIASKLRLPGETRKRVRFAMASPFLWMAIAWLAFRHLPDPNKWALMGVACGIVGAAILAWEADDPDEDCKKIAKDMILSVRQKRGIWLGNAIMVLFIALYEVVMLVNLYLTVSLYWYDKALFVGHVLLALGLVCLPTAWVWAERRWRQWWERKSDEMEAGSDQNRIRQIKRMARWYGFFLFAIAGVLQMPVLMVHP